MYEKNIRIIPKLDIKNGLLIKGINLEGLRIWVTLDFTGIIMKMELMK